MSQTTAPPRAGLTPAPSLSSLIASEIIRARSRRALRWMSLIGVLAVLGVSALMFVNSAPLEQADLDASAAQYLADQEQYYQQCLEDGSIPQEQKQQACWKPSEEEARQNALWYLPKQPFLASDMEGLLSLAGGIGVLICLMVAASSGGADWTARTMGLVLSWEPRRVRVFLVRLGVVSAGGLAIVTVMVGLALGLGLLIAQSHGLAGEIPGPMDAEPVDSGEATELALRWLPLALLGAGAGFGLAMATRSTGWAIGAAIGFVAIVESFLGQVWTWGSQWLVQTNIAAWLSGGMVWVVDRTPVQSGSELEMGSGGSEEYVTPGAIWISDTRAILTLAAMCISLLVLSALLLRARDVD